MKRVILLVIDGFGIGGASDAEAYGDADSDTYKAVRHFADLPVLRGLGLDNIDGIDACKTDYPSAALGRLEEKSAGKDTTTGHFELLGLVVEKPFPTYPDGFPKSVVDRLQEAFGCKILGNVAASGTEIINELGDEHIKTRYPIVYTSADSVLQIACHEDVYSVSELYDLCEKARAIMSGGNAVSRIIARPFIGFDGKYKRTDKRKDFSLPPFGETIFDKLKKEGLETVSVGKIYDIFCGQGISKKYEAHSNEESFGAVLKAMSETDNGLIFANFVETDMLYGHRNDVAGYAACLEAFDMGLELVIKELKASDVLIVTSDHGCDPSTDSTDHSRENVPLLIFGQGIKPVNLGKIIGFDCVADFIYEYLTNCKTGIIAEKVLKQL